jgi:hypothetical protein
LDAERWIIRETGGRLCVIIWGRIADGHQRRDALVVAYHDTIHIYTNGIITDQNTLEWHNGAGKGILFKPDGQTVTMFLPNASQRLPYNAGFEALPARIMYCITTERGSFTQTGNDALVVNAYPWPWKLPRIRINHPAFGRAVRCIKL